MDQLFSQVAGIVDFRAVPGRPHLNKVGLGPADFLAVVPLSCLPQLFVWDDVLETGSQAAAAIYGTLPGSRAVCPVLPISRYQGRLTQTVQATGSEAAGGQGSRLHQILTQMTGQVGRHLLRRSHLFLFPFDLSAVHLSMFDGVEGVCRPKIVDLALFEETFEDGGGIFTKIERVNAGVPPELGCGNSSTLVRIKLWVTIMRTITNIMARLTTPMTPIPLRQTMLLTLHRPLLHLFLLHLLLLKVLLLLFLIVCVRLRSGLLPHRGFLLLAVLLVILVLVAILVGGEVCHGLGGGLETAVLGVVGRLAVYFGQEGIFEFGIT